METGKIAAKFKELYNSKPIISRAPGRVNLIGEHTDYNDGFVLPAAVDKEIVFAIQKNDLNKIRAFSFDKSEKGECDIANLKKQDGWINYIIGVFHEVAVRGVKIGGTDLVFAGDVPIGAGMSSSAALECALANALNTLYNGKLDKLQLALAAQAAEHNFAGVKCGLMDQYASMFGKTDTVIKLDCRTQKHEYFHFDFSGFALVLCDTGVKHTLASSEYNVRRSQCEQGVKTIQSKYPEVKNLRDVTPAMIEEFKSKLDQVIYKRCLYVVEEDIRVDKACDSLIKNDFVNFGKFMYQSHDGLQNMYEVSCKELDFLVELTRNDENVLGSRMMGGGFGGCTINLVKREKVDQFVNAIAPAYKKKFGIDMEHYIVKIGEGARVEQ